MQFLFSFQTIQKANGIQCHVGINLSTIAIASKLYAANGYSGPFTIGHDATSIKPHISVDLSCNPPQLCGFVQQSEAEKIELHQSEYTQQEFDTLIADKKLATQLYIFVLRPVVRKLNGLKLPSFTVALYFINGTPCAPNLLAMQTNLLRACADKGMMVKFVGADGDVVNKAMVEHLMYSLNSLNRVNPAPYTGRFVDHGLFVYERPEGPIFVPDPMHMVSKAGQNLLSTVRPIRIGEYVATHSNNTPLH